MIASKRVDNTHHLMARISNGVILIITFIITRLNPSCGEIKLYMYNLMES